jgi:hypothetical protein
MRKQQHGQQQRLPGDAKPAAAAAAGAPAGSGVIPDSLGAGGLKVPKAYHEAAVAAAQHAGGAAPGLLEQLKPPQLRNWMQDKAALCKDAALREWRQQLSELIQEQMEDMLRQLEEQEGSQFFLNPVDTHKYPDYAQEVTHPMCLEWIKQALRSGKYQIEQQQQQRPPLQLHSWQSLYAFAHDVQLIVSNARLYNGGRPQNRRVLDAAHALQKKAVHCWSKVQANISSKLKQGLEAHKQQQQQG